MNGCFKGCAVFMSLLGIAISLAPAIAALVIGVRERDTDCDDDSFISLSNWLITYGSVGLGITVILILSFIATIGAVAADSMLGLFAGGGVTLAIVLCMLGWNIAWNIVGAVALFRDSMDCIDSCISIWVMTCVALALQWIGFLQSFCGVRKNDNSV